MLSASSYGRTKVKLEFWSQYKVLCFGVYGSFTFVQNRNTLFITFCLRPKVDDFLWWKGMPGGVVYGRMMDLCCLYGPETTDSMDIEVKRG